MNEKELHAKLQQSGMPGIGELDESTTDPFVMIEPDGLVDAVRFLRDDPGCAMEMLQLVTATEREQCIEVAYHLCSYSQHHSLTVKTSVARPDGAGVEWLPEVPSVAGIYRSADWHEREQWDLLGVRFTGHSDLRRILLPEEWIGHPLRKQYVYPSEHGGIPLELDAVPIYERDGAPAEEPREPRAPGTPLIQPPAPRSDRPHAGGQAPAKEGDS